MRYVMTRVMVCFVVCLFVSLALAPWGSAQQRDYKVTLADLEENKHFLDDPRPLFKGKLAYENWMPPDVYKKLTFDKEQMKSAWAEIVGFKAPDVVGKIAPEIKPGKYTYQDKEKHPGLKELMIPFYYDIFKPGGPPFAGNFPEITVIPTRQYYYALPVAEGTKKYAGQAKIDNAGYLAEDSYTAGLPFPKPSGPFKAAEIMYNWEKRYWHWENFFIAEYNKGYNKDLVMDYNGGIDWWDLRLQGRLLMEPYGWYDERARERKEYAVTLLRHVMPRDNYGTAFVINRYVPREELDQFHIYVNVLRRIRKMSATDTQDAVAGQDCIYEDKEGFSQKLNPKRYPYKFELIGEREYLVPTSTIDGSMYMSSKGLEFRNVEFERRPVYVIQGTQLDKNYVYSKRVFYIDKETFLLFHIQNYDQKGRLYRSMCTYTFFNPEMGMFGAIQVGFRDHIDTHSAVLLNYVTPAPWVTREHVNLGGLIAKGK
jgi:hypothetical protein